MEERRKLERVAHSRTLLCGVSVEKIGCFVVNGMPHRVFPVANTLEICNAHHLHSVCLLPSTFSVVTAINLS